MSGDVLRPEYQYEIRVDEGAAAMKTCLSCQQPIPTLQDLRRDRRWQWVSISVVLLLVGIITGSVGYLVRDSVFLKRENGVLWKLVNVYVGKVEVDKVVDQNTALKKRR